MRKGIMLGSLIFLVWSTGCASSGITKYLPKETGPGYCEVTFIRSSHIIAISSEMAIILDRRIVAYLHSGEYISFPLKPGTHSLSISGGVHNTPALDYDFEPNCQKYFYGSLSFSTWIEVEEIPKEEALDKMKGDKRITNLLEED